MKTYSIYFTVQLSDGSVIFSQVFSVVSRSIESAAMFLESDLLFLSRNFPSDFYVVYDLSKIYCNGK